MNEGLNLWIFRASTLKNTCAGGRASYLQVPLVHAMCPRVVERIQHPVHLAQVLPRVH